jgi:hypothetical protein
MSKAVTVEMGLSHSDGKRVCLKVDRLAATAATAAT